MNMIRHYVDNLHVSTSNRVILRELYNRMVAHPENMTLSKKQDRRTVYRYALQVHAANRRMYSDVVNGRF